MKCRITEVHQLQVRGSLFQPTRTLIKKLLEITDFMSVVLQLQPTTQSARVGGDHRLHCLWGFNFSLQHRALELVFRVLAKGARVRSKLKHHQHEVGGFAEF